MSVVVKAANLSQVERRLGYMKEKAPKVLKMAVATNHFNFADEDDLKLVPLSIFPVALIPPAPVWTHT